MAKDKTPPPNPLFSKNIPAPPPMGTDESGSERENGITGKGDTTITVKRDNDNPVIGDNGNMVKGDTTITVKRDNDNPVIGDSGIRQKGQSAISDLDEEKATIEVSLYLRPRQDDKLEDLRRAYKRKTGKKISANEAMRRLIEHARLEDLLEPPG